METIKILFIGICSLIANQLNSQVVSIPEDKLFAYYDIPKLKQASQEIEYILNNGNFKFLIADFDPNSTCYQHLCFNDFKLSERVFIDNLFNLNFPTDNGRKIYRLDRIDKKINVSYFVKMPELESKSMEIGKGRVIKIHENANISKLSTQKKIDKIKECNNQIDRLYSLFSEVKSIYKVANETYMKETIINFKKECDSFKKNENELTMSEEQRKFIVQANAQNEEKKYYEALKLFKKVTEINSYSYPPTYFNMALLYAQLNDYEEAILSMKKYLILVPDAEDSRKAQDKIYEWELKIQ